MAKLIKRGKNWYSYFKAGGKRIKRSLGPDHDQARIALNRLVEQYQIKGISSTRLNPSWLVFQAKYLAFRQSEPIKENTIYWDQLAFRHMDELFKVTRIESIDKTLLIEYQNKLSKLMVASSVNRLVRSIKQAIKKASEWGNTVASDIGAKRLKESEGRLIWYTPEQCQKILAKCKGKWLTMALLGIRAGLRRSEIAWLTWNDIDLKSGLLRITGKAGWKPKGGKSRHIPMAHDLQKHLAELQNKEGFLFDHDDQALDVMTSYFIKLIDKAGCEGSLHAFRHTFGSHLVQAGVPLIMVKELMGHSKIETTMIYAHLAPDNLTSSIQKLPKLGVILGVTQ